MLWLRATQLKSRFTNLRLKAATHLGESKDPRAIIPLLEAANDEDPLVRVTVYQSLLNLGPLSIDTLHKALSDRDDKRRWMAVHILGRTGDKNAVLPLMSVTNDHSALVRLEVAEGLGRLKDRRAAKNLISLLKDLDPEVRVAAAAALGQIPTAKAVEPMLQVFHDGNIETKVAVARALVSPGWETIDARQRCLVALTIKEWLSALEVQFWDAAAYDISDKTTAHMNALVTEKATDGMVEILTQPFNSIMRRLAAEALGKMGEPKAVPALLEVSAEDDMPLRKSALEALQEIGAAGFEEMLNGLAHPSPDVRKTAIIALSRINEPGACPAFAEALKDPDWNVRFAAAQALGEFPGQPQTASSLISALRDPELKIALAAANSLAKVADHAHATALTAETDLVTNGELKAAIQKAAEAAQNRRPPEPDTSIQFTAQPASGK